MTIFKKLGVDVHSLIGGGGCFATFTLTDINTGIASAVGLATFTYMTFRALREFNKWRKDK